MAQQRGRRIALAVALLVVGVLAIGISFSDALIEEYYLYHLRGDDAERREEAYAKLIEMGSLKAVPVIVRHRVERKGPTYDGLVDIAVLRPEGFATAVRALLRPSNERPVRCFAAYLLSEIAWESDGAAAALEALQSPEDAVLRRCTEVAIQEIKRKLTAPRSLSRMGLVVAETRSGLSITSVQPGSAAARVDLRPGDTLEMLNDVEVRQLQDMILALRGAGAIVPLRLRRGDRTIATHIIPDAQSSWRAMLPLIWEGEQDA